MELTIREIADATQGTFALKPSGNPLLSEISWDSRSVHPRSLFVALPGNRVDGHDFIVDALKAGAKAIVMMRQPREEERVVARNNDAALILVDDGAKAIYRLAQFWRQRLHALVIAITGSSGKTTTKNFTRSVLETRFRIHSTFGNQNNELGAPKTILDAPLDCQVLLLELGISAPGEMEQLCALAQPDWGVIVGIGASHLEFLKDERTVAREKAQLWRCLPQDGRAFGCADDSWVSYCYDEGDLARGVSFTLFGWGDENGQILADAHEEEGEDESSSAEALARLLRKYPQTLTASNLSCDQQGRPSFMLTALESGTSTQASVSLQLVGAHNALDACAAAAVGVACGIDLQTIAQALSATAPEAGRSEIVEAGRGFTIINDAYNANPSSMRSVLSSFGSLEGYSHRYAVLGDMGELGAAANGAHRDLGAYAAALGLDGIVFVGKLSHLGAQAARETKRGSLQIWECENAQQAYNFVEENLKPGDVLLVKGSRFVGLDLLVKELL